MKIRGYLANFKVLIGTEIAAKILIFELKKTEMHDREANRTYRDRTAESKYLSAVGPSEAELLLNRMGLRPK